MNAPEPEGLSLRKAPYALRVVRRQGGLAAIVLRREPHPATKRDRLKRVGTVSPTAFTAGSGLLREAVAVGSGRRVPLQPGGSLPLDHAWGARVACYARVSHGLRDAERLGRAADELRRSAESEAAWWLGQLLGAKGSRALRALRILTEAVA